MPVKAVLLDVDDTLLDTTAAMYAAAAAGLAVVWPGQPRSWHVEAGVRFRHDPGGYFARFTAGELDFGPMRALRLAEVADHYALEVPAGASDAFEDAFRPAFLAHQHRYDDVLPFLDACAAAGLVVGALTNSSDAATQPKLVANQLTERFATVVTRDTFGVGKPDRRVFEHACARLGVQPAQTAYIGDEWAPDIEGSRGAGLHPIWIRRSSAGASAAGERVPFVTSLEQVRPVPDGLEVPDLGRAAPTG